MVLAGAPLRGSCRRASEEIMMALLLLDEHELLSFFLVECFQEALMFIFSLVEGFLVLDKQVSLYLLLLLICIAIYDACCLPTADLTRLQSTAAGTSCTSAIHLCLS